MESTTHIVSFPNGDEFHSCRACATLACGVDGGARARVSAVGMAACELAYNGCDDSPASDPEDYFDLEPRADDVVGISPGARFPAGKPNPFDASDRARAASAVRASCERDDWQS